MHVRCRLARLGRVQPSVRLCTVVALLSIIQLVLLRCPSGSVDVTEAQKLGGYLTGVL